MKASVLISELAKLLEVHGDLEVSFAKDGHESPVAGARFVAEGGLTVPESGAVQMRFEHEKKPSRIVLNK